MRISQFPHTWEKRSEEISFKTFIEGVQNGRWAVLTQGYRRCLEQEKPKEASTLKGNLPAVALSGHGVRAVIRVNVEKP